MAALTLPACSARPCTLSLALSYCSAWHCWHNGYQLQAGIAPIDRVEAGELHRILDVLLIEIGVALDAIQPFFAVHGVGMIVGIDVHAPHLAVVEFLFQARIGVAGQARFIADRFGLLKLRGPIGRS